MWLVATLVRSGWAARRLSFVRLLFGPLRLDGAALHAVRPRFGMEARVPLPLGTVGQGGGGGGERSLIDFTPTAEVQSPLSSTCALLDSQHWRSGGPIAGDRSQRQKQNSEGAQRRRSEA